MIWAATIAGAPRTKKNHGKVVVVRGRRLHVGSDAHHVWEISASIQLRAQWAQAGHRGALAERVEVTAEIYRDAERGDLVGYLQALGDALEKAGVVADDKWIASWDGSRLLVDRERPRIELVVGTEGV